jgi:hypothetical protein
MSEAAKTAEAMPEAESSGEIERARAEWIRRIESEHEGNIESPLAKGFMTETMARRMDGIAEKLSKDERADFYEQLATLRELSGYDTQERPKDEKNLVWKLSSENLKSIDEKVRKDVLYELLRNKGLQQRFAPEKMETNPYCGLIVKKGSPQFMMKALLDMPPESFDGKPVLIRQPNDFETVVAGEKEALEADPELFADLMAIEALHAMELENLGYTVFEGEGVHSAQEVWKKYRGHQVLNGVSVAVTAEGLVYRVGRDHKKNDVPLARERAEMVEKLRESLGKPKQEKDDSEAAHENAELRGKLAEALRQVDAEKEKAAKAELEAIRLRNELAAAKAPISGHDSAPSAAPSGRKRWWSWGKR